MALNITKILDSTLSLLTSMEYLSLIIGLIVCKSNVLVMKLVRRMLRVYIVFNEHIHFYC